ncbi:helix-turn-helix domain-containing protein [Pantoea sp. PNT03]|jgi:AraC family transcriptional activator of mar-sox-rob regulon|uniref:helix-turn-helix domain-containing protein n=1 Tax=Pantoea sp. PNT03 TaxID=2769258 RepID=UPI001782B3FA|nr:helix-turn-helix domain-containing protein [Pantoea sp. PNT03]MBD9660116.1 helix-turn-helix domain-containing protein [Pantoea sp. PNT03]
MKSFTRDLIIWIEENLDKKIILDEVAEKSGYSKWHLQRLFRQETGMKLATYIRERRLSESAILLKMTSAPVIHAAEKFGFTNQQAFTRTFTKYFCLPPARYRQTREWHFRGLQPSLLSNAGTMTEPETTWLSARAF